MSSGYKGAQSPVSGASQFNSIEFMIAQVLNKSNTATLVQVKAVTNSGDVSAVGFVDVRPLVSQIDGDGNSVPHGVLHRIPYVRMQGGANAVILDPQVNDIGIAVFADRDISSVKANKKESLPASGRRFDMADGLYVGGVLNGVPTQYVQFSTAGINITSPTKVTITAPETDVIGALKNNGVNVGSTHEHGNVTNGPDVSGGPQ